MNANAKSRIAPVVSSPDRAAAPGARALRSIPDASGARRRVLESFLRARPGVSQEGAFGATKAFYGGVLPWLADAPVARRRVLESFLRARPGVSQESAFQATKDYYRTSDGAWTRALS